MRRRMENAIKFRYILQIIYPLFVLRKGLFAFWIPSSLMDFVDAHFETKQQFSILSIGKNLYSLYSTYRGGLEYDYWGEGVKL